MSDPLPVSEDDSENAENGAEVESSEGFDDEGYFDVHDLCALLLLIGILVVVVVLVVKGVGWVLG